MKVKILVIALVLLAIGAVGAFAGDCASHGKYNGNGACPLCSSFSSGKSQGKQEICDSAADVLTHNQWKAIGCE